jgi:hypothetical protein
MLSILSQLHSRTAALEHRLGMDGHTPVVIQDDNPPTATQMELQDLQELWDEKKNITYEYYTAHTEIYRLVEDEMRAVNDTLDVFIFCDIVQRLRSPQYFTIQVMKKQNTGEVPKDRLFTIYGFVFDDRDTRLIISEYFLRLADNRQNIILYYKLKTSRSFRMEQTIQNIVYAWMVHGFDTLGENGVQGMLRRTGLVLDD